MRQPYRNLFGSCLLAVLILPSHALIAAPLQDAPGDAQSSADPAPAGIRSAGNVPGGVSDGLRDDVTARGLASYSREPVLGRTPTPVAPGQAAPISLGLGAGGPIRTIPPVSTKVAAGAALMASSAQAATMSDAPAAPAPGQAQSPLPSAPGAGVPGTNAPPSGFSAPRPVMPAALTEALTALQEKKPDDAIRIARTFISQAEAKGPGPDSTPPSMALAHEIVGTALAVQGKPDDAVVELKKALSYNPEQTSAQFKLGVIYREQGKLPEAKASMEKAVAAGGGIPVKLYLGDVNERMGDIPAALAIYEPLLTTERADDVKFKVHVASLYNRVNRFADTIKLLQPIVKADSKDIEGLMMLGFAYSATGKPKDAMPLLAAAKVLAPNNWRVDLALGMAQREAGEFDAALVSLKSAVAAEPKQIQARFQLALVQMAKSQFNDAIDTLTETEKLAPKSPEIKQVLGDAYFRVGKKDEALAEFRELAIRDGATLNDTVNLARVYQAMGRLDDAAQTYRDAMQKFPPNPGVNALLALVQAQQKKYDDARETIANARKTTPDDPRLLRALIQTEIAAGENKAALSVAQHLVDIQPKSLEDRYTLGTLYERLGDRKRAIGIYQALLAEVPNNAIILNNLAVIMTDDGDAKGALPLARKALALNPNSAATNDTLGWALLKLGQSKDALPMLELATKTDPANPELLYHLAVAQKAQNNPKAARTSLEKALAINTTFNGAADAKSLLASLPK